MPFITTTIKELKDKNGWYELTASDGNKYSTKLDKIVHGFQVGDVVALEYSERENGKFKNRYIQSLQLSGETDPNAGKSLPAETENPWPGKDRAIAMESAFASAARFYQYKPEATPDDLVTLAVGIYQQVERARAGEFQP